MKPDLRWVVLATLLSCRSPVSDELAGQEQRFEFAEPHMGTVFRLVLYAKEPATARRAATAAFTRIAELEEVFSDYRSTSELRQVLAKANAGAEGQAMQVSESLFEVLSSAQRVTASSEGAFDVTVGAAVRLWRRSAALGRLPDEETMARSLRSVGLETLALDHASQTVRFLAPDMHLDLGGVAKGFTLDEALEVLRESGVPRSLVDGGGDIAVGEAPPGRDAWIIRLEAPGLPPGSSIALARAAVATSADSGRTYLVNGRSYSHLVDPGSGQPLERAVTAVVVAQTGAAADAWASAWCVLFGRGTMDSPDSGDVQVLLAAPDQGIIAKSAGFPGWEEEPVRVR